MLYTITNTGLSNGRPIAVGANTISILNRTTHIFTIANFTTETSPVYSDPEGDALSYIKILQLPVNGILKLSGVNVNLNQIIISANISAGNLTYVSNAVDPSYSEIFKFDVADVGSQSLSGLTTGIITMSVAAIVNSAPTCVGDNTIPKSYNETHVFTVANFTSETSPIYADPDGDAAYAVKVLTLPTDGDLYFNGVLVSVNQEILMTEVTAGLLTYVPDPLILIAQSLPFNFALSDVGSKTFISTCI
tara:strand:+ start:9945 stop:10688 length:744 start_codon:yes stop_codon:yes gene_type:complete